MTMSKDAFSAALRAEIEAVVARYEALARAHQESLFAIREQEVAKLRADVATLIAERERGKQAEADLKARLAESMTRAERLERELATARAAIEDEQRQTREAKARAEALAAESRRRVEQLGAELERAQSTAASLGEAFATERSFVEATRGLEGTLLYESLRAALGVEPAPSPSVFSELKSRRPETVLLQTVKDRGRTAASAPLSERESQALRKLAEAAGCELIVPERGVRFSSASMEKGATRSDPAEEGNVLDTLVPGLRMAGTEGAMVFPRVLVATG